MESQLVSIETLPTAILTIILAYDPHMLNALPQLETVIAFFYGNRVPLSILQRVQWAHIHACERTILFFNEYC